MWQPLFPGRRVDERADHPRHQRRARADLAAGPMRELLDRHLGARLAGAAPTSPRPGRRWTTSPPPSCGRRAAPARAQLVELIRERAIGDRLRRGEPLDYAEAAAGGFDPDRLTIGFARRLATYKRLHLLAPDARARARAARRRASRCSSSSPARPTPTTSEAKEVVRQLFELKRAPGVAGRVRLPRGLRHVRSPPSWSPAATCGSTCRGRRSRPAAPAA